MSNYNDYENGYGEATYSDDTYEYEVYDEQSGEWIVDQGYHDDTYYDEAVYITADGYEYIEDDPMPRYLEPPDIIPEYQPIWTWRRIAYLAIAFLIVASLVLYLVLPLLNLSSSAPPPPPADPAWML